MKVFILLLNQETLGGIEKVSANLKFILNMAFDNVELVDVPLLKMENKKNESELYLFYKFIENLSDDDVVISMYDRISIKIGFLRMLYKFKFKLIACQHADFYAHRVHTRFIRSFIYKYVDHVVALTSVDANLYRNLGLKTKKIPNPILFYPDEVASYSYRSDNIIAAGRLHKIKNFYDFINLASSMAGISSLSFLLFGDGDEKAALSIHAKNIGLDPIKIIRGKTDTLDKELLNSKFLIVTSERESFSMVILEAMASGCIPISYDCPTGPRELIENGVNGFLVSPGDIVKMNNIILMLINDPELAQVVQNNARKTALNYSCDAILNEWRELINGI